MNPKALFIIDLANALKQTRGESNGVSISEFSKILKSVWAKEEVEALVKELK